MGIDNCTMVMADLVATEDIGVGSNGQMGYGWEGHWELAAP